MLPPDTNLATYTTPSVQVAEGKQELDELAASEADMMGGPPVRSIPLKPLEYIN